jgi:hypothetical protein
MELIFMSIFCQGRKPILGIPFMAITWLILPAFYNNHNSPDDNRLSMTQKLIRVSPSNVATPEVHRLFLKECRKSKPEHQIEKM